MWFSTEPTSTRPALRAATFAPCSAAVGPVVICIAGEEGWASACGSGSAIASGSGGHSASAALGASTPASSTDGDGASAATASSCGPVLGAAVPDGMNTVRAPSGISSDSSLMT